MFTFLEALNHCNGDRRLIKDIRIKDIFFWLEISNGCSDKNVKYEVI